MKIKIFQFKIIKIEVKVKNKSQHKNITNY